MVSLDSAEKNTRFAESLEGNFPVLSDPTKEVARAYGVLGLGGLFAKRWTFYIDAEGTIRKIDKKTRTGTAGEDLTAYLEELGFPKRE